MTTTQCQPAAPCFEASSGTCALADATLEDGRGRPFCDRAAGLQCQNGNICYDSSFGCVCSGLRPCRQGTGACMPSSASCFASTNASALQNCVGGSSGAASLVNSLTTTMPAATATPGGTDIVSTITTCALVLGALVAIAIVVFAIRARRRRLAMADEPALLTDHESIPALLSGRQRSTRKPSSSPRPQTLVGSSVGTTGSAVSSSSGSKGAYAMGDLDMHRVDIGDITIMRTLAQGAYGEVLLGRYQGAVVAIKRLLPTTQTRDDVEKFIREAQLVARLDSTYIAAFVGVAWTKPQELLLMTEFLPRGDLRSLLEADANLPWPAKLRIAHDIAEGLVYLHMLEHKVLHRDLKSRNVLLTDDLHAKLTDFGISRELDDATMTAGIGTYRWMAPEVLQDGHYDESADMYSFGVILSELDSHKLPYSDVVTSTGRPLTDTAIMAKVMLGQLRPTFSDVSPSWLRELGIRCLSEDPYLRPRAAEAAYKIQVELRRFEH
ncbi:TKL protein kinase [Saprolegnia diclina VS20]|uniref:TKL protein kinase n=1 Tax=Saprolegnia diclina (strain VS20) TaxID=1156394 RepID=T0S9T3_SAPDV|nr:TKL protein kinase [Saprolegnia diclina VS20]EQC42043.1 TKL protein kinase [Saprolegnia diclina VS20]|eukprot:XP_008604612.1 TKL protein kinase [Saprolegnia diclina VS20]